MDDIAYKNAKATGWREYSDRYKTGRLDRATRGMLETTWDEAFRRGYWFGKGRHDHLVELREMVGKKYGAVKEAWDHSETAIAMASVALVLALAAIVVVIVNVLKGGL